MIGLAFAIPGRLSIPFRRSLAAVLSGALYAAAFPGWDHWYLGFFQFVPLLWALRGASPLLAFVLGWVAGCSAQLLGFAWLIETLPTLTGMGRAASIASWLLICSYQGAALGVACGLAVWASSHLPRWLVWPCAVAALEAGFPFIVPHTSAAIFHDCPLLLQPLALLGAPLVTFLLCAANAALEEGIHRRSDPRLASAWLLAALAIVGIWFGYGLFILRGAATSAIGGQALGAHATVAIVQPNASAELKRRSPQGLLLQHLKMTQEATAGAAPDLVVWGETVLSSPIRESAFASTLLSRLGEVRVPLLTGAVIERGDGTRTNSVLFVDANTAVCPKCRYDKQHLVPIAEGGLAPGGGFVPGNHRLPVSVGSHQAAALVCFEALFPALVRKLARDSEVLINLSNDAWFEGTHEPQVHLALARLRTVENRRYLIRAASTGESAIVDPWGQTVASTHRTGIVRGAFQWRRDVTLYQLVGDWPLLAVMLSLGGVWISRRRTSRRDSFQHGDEKSCCRSSEPHSER